MIGWRLLGAVGIVAVISIAGVVFAQVPPRLAFEVAAIKQGDSSAEGGSLAFQAGGRFVATNMRAADFVTTAFRTDRPLLSQQILGLPAWATTVRYSVSAKISTDAPADAAASFAHVNEYVRSLLEDRFALKAHMEKRDMPVYKLTITDGGSRVHQSTVDCGKPENRRACGVSFSTGRVTGNMTIANLVGPLSGPSGRIVIDATHLDGRFDIDVQWNAGGDPSDERPSIFTAVQEQLGFKLQSTRAPVDVLVIDRIERPTED